MKRIFHPLPSIPFRKISGPSLFEVLMAIVILTFGLLGLAALQGKANTAELEAYQRGQALILLQDMTSRIENNVTNVANYVTGTAAPLGVGTTDEADCSTLTNRAAIDLCEWSKELKGASEASGNNNKKTKNNKQKNVEIVTTGTEYKV